MSDGQNNPDDVGGGEPHEAEELRGIHRWITDLMRGARAEEGWAVASGSPLAEDDIRTRPLQTSHTAHAAITVAMDHLFSLTFLTGEHRMLSTNSVYTLARGAIETAALGYWLVEPPRRLERIERTLRLKVHDARDQYQAAADLGATENITLEQRMAEIRAVAEAAGLDAESDQWSRPVHATAVVRVADDQLRGLMTPGPLGAWRMFSGLAHARQWPTVFFDHEIANVRGDVHKVRYVNPPSRVLFAAKVAQRVINLAEHTYEQRARSPYDGVFTDEPT